MERKQLKSVDENVNINDNDNVWDFEAYYLAQQCLNLLYITSVEKIIIGGGVSNRECLLPKIQEWFVKLNNNYIQNEVLITAKNYIVRTAFKNDSGILSALILK